jgi:hypothetical protein
MGFVFKMNSHGEFTYYLRIRRNTIVYVAFCCNRLSLLFYLQYKDFKKIFKHASLYPTSRTYHFVCVVVRHVSQLKILDVTKYGGWPNPEG